MVVKKALKAKNVLSHISLRTFTSIAMDSCRLQWMNEYKSWQVDNRLEIHSQRDGYDFCSYRYIFTKTKSTERR